MSLLAIIKDPSRRQLRQFGGIFLPAFLGVVALLVRRTGSSWTVPGALLGVAALSVGTALVRPGLMRAPFVGLQYVAYPIGWVVSHVLMAVVYFGVVTPVGFLVRTFRGDPMTRRLDPQAPSHWVPHKGRLPLERYFRQY